MIYLDVGGQGPGLVPPDQALIPASDRGLLYGDGLFETVLVRDGRMPLLPLHLERLSGSAAELGIAVDENRLREAAEAVVACHTGGGPELALRITVTRGIASRRGYEPPPDAAPTVLITIAPYRRPAGPLRAITATGLRADPASPLSRHKSLSALEKVLARAQAARAGADEALLLNRSGRVAEGASSNLFIVRDGRWMTPPTSEGCLPGVMRRRVIDLTDAVEAPLQPEEVHSAEGVFLTSALLGCLPLGSLDGRPLPQGPEPPALADLLSPDG